jgi:hypothetical protein
MNILGCPVKISSGKSIYFPVNYFHTYHIGIHVDCMIRQQFETYFIFRPYCERELLPNEIIVKIRAGSTYLPEQWLIDNHLTPGKDNLYLVGIDNGFLLSATARISL